MLTAAYTDVDGSEQNSELAFAVNGEGTKNVACVPQERGAKLFYVSTDYLFDGPATHRIEPDHLIAPLSLYGQSKAARKRPFEKITSAWCIAHTSWLFGTSGTCFPRESPRLLRERIHESQVF